MAIVMPVQTLTPGTPQSIQLNDEMSQIGAVLVHNASDCTLTLAGVGAGSVNHGAWIEMLYQHDQISDTLNVLAQVLPGGPSSPLTSLVLTLFRKGEPLPAGHWPASIPRPNVGVTGSVNTVSTQQLYDSGLDRYFRVSFNSGIGLTGTIFLEPIAASDGSATAMGFRSRRSGGSNGLAVVMYFDDNANVVMDTAFSALAGIAAGGTYGVPFVLGTPGATAFRQLVTSTAATNVVSVTPTVTGTYMLLAFIRKNNTTPPNTLTLQATFFDPDKAGGVSDTVNFFAWVGTQAGPTMLNAASLNNNYYTCLPVLINHTAGKLLTVAYTDSTGTPSDNVTVLVVPVY